MGTALRTSMRPSSAAPAGEAAKFASSLGISLSEQAAIVVTLEGMHAEQQCRGMFFQGVLDVLQLGSKDAKKVLADLGITPPRTPFGLYSHHDFYKLCFWATSKLYPDVPMSKGLFNLAASFFPIFKESMVGRTIASLMGTRAGPILSRLVEAYALCVPRNKHALVWRGTTGAEWTCEVELCEYYPDIFRGIVLGTMREQGVPEPVVEVASRRILPESQVVTFSIRWKD